MQVSLQIVALFSMLMAPRVGIAAHYQANIVVSLLVDSESAKAQIPDILEQVA